MPIDITPDVAGCTVFTAIVVGALALLVRSGWRR